VFKSRRNGGQIDFHETDTLITRKTQLRTRARVGRRWDILVYNNVGAPGHESALGFSRNQGVGSWEINLAAVLRRT